MNERNRPKDYDNIRDGRRAPPPRNEERHHRHSSSTSHHHKDRYNSSRDSSRRQHHRAERYERTDRSAERHRERRASPSSPPPQQQHKRSYRGGGHNNASDERSRPHRHRESRSRSRSRSRTPRSHSRERHAAPLEQARLSALEMERKLIVDDEDGIGGGTQSSSSSSSNNNNNKPNPSRNSAIEALMSLPLSDTAPKQPNVIAVAPAVSSLSSAGAGYAAANIGEPAVIQLPSYYNPSVINPNKYAEQVQKRKLLWGAKKAEDTAAKWGNAQFSQDSDGKVASKFMRLMGIKGGAGAKAEVPTAPKAVDGEKKATVAATAAPDVKSREAMFSSMEQQYEVARQVTHTMRGVGLGFSSQSRPF